MRPKRQSKTAPARPSGCKSNALAGLGAGLDTGLGAGLGAKLGTKLGEGAIGGTAPRGSLGVELPH